MDRNFTVIAQLVRLGKDYDIIRALVLTSTRANPNAFCDILSDYDVILYTADLGPLLRRDDWFESFGPILVSGPRERYLKMGWQVPARLVLYEDGTRIDFSIQHVDELRRLCDQGLPPDDHGYRVLLDKDGLTASLGRPTHREFMPEVPAETDYTSVVVGFWWNSHYVAKYLWRDDLMAANSMLDGLRQNELRRMLEWSVELDRGWAWKPGVMGRGLIKELNPDMGRELSETYAGGDTEGLWESLFRTTALFQKVSARVGERLGYNYPAVLGAKVAIFHRTIRDLDRHGASSEDLAKSLKESYHRYRGGK